MYVLIIKEDEVLPHLLQSTNSCGIVYGIVEHCDLELQ